MVDAVAYNALQQAVGEAGSAEAEVFVGKPFFAEYFLDDGIVLHGVFGGAHASGGLEAHAVAGLFRSTP